MEENKIIRSLKEAMQTLEEEKPNDRSARDREYAILKTELEKLIWMVNSVVPRE